MNPDPNVAAVIQQYVDAVAASLKKDPVERREATLRAIREHINEALSIRTRGRPANPQDAYAVLSTMDPPGNYADSAAQEEQELKPNWTLISLGLICSGLQIVGLIAAVTGVHGVGSIAGFAAIVSFFVVWSQKRRPRWILHLLGVAAVCGLGLIIIEIARAL